MNFDAWIILQLETTWQSLDMVCALVCSGVGFNLSIHDIKRSSNLVYEVTNFIRICGYWIYIVIFGGRQFVCRKHVFVTRFFSYLPTFSQCLEEIISGDRWLAFKIGKPEYSGILMAQVFNNLIIDVVVDDIFEINLIKIICPWMQNRKALVLNALDSVLLNIFLDKLEIRFVGSDRVGKIILVNNFLRISNEWVDCFDAWWRLKILVLDLAVKRG